MNSKLRIFLQIFSGTDDASDQSGGRVKDIRAGFTDAVIDRTGNVSKATGAADRGGATNKAIARAAAAARKLRPPEEVHVQLY